jgi:hypothetical protein
MDTWYATFMKRGKTIDWQDYIADSRCGSAANVPHLDPTLSGQRDVDLVNSRSCYDAWGPLVDPTGTWLMTKRWCVAQFGSFLLGPTWYCWCLLTGPLLGWYTGNMSNGRIWCPHADMPGRRHGVHARTGVLAMQAGRAVCCAPVVAAASWRRRLSGRWRACLPLRWSAVRYGYREQRRKATS